MKYIKLYESLNEPKKGDYVLCEEDEIPRWAKDNLLKVYDFIATHVGKFVHKLRFTENNDILSDYRYIIEYENLPEELEKYFPYEKSVKNKSKEKRYRRMCLKNIKHISKNKEDLELLLKGKSYNL